jgi:hypothetical protein
MFRSPLPGWGAVVLDRQSGPVATEPCRAGTRTRPPSAGPFSCPCDPLCQDPLTFPERRGTSPQLALPNARLPLVICERGRTAPPSLSAGSSCGRQLPNGTRYVGTPERTLRTAKEVLMTTLAAQVWTELQVRVVTPNIPTIFQRLIPNDRLYRVISPGNGNARLRRAGIRRRLLPRTVRVPHRRSPAPRRARRRRLSRPLPVPGGGPGRRRNQGRAGR